MDASSDHEAAARRMALEKGGLVRLERLPADRRVRVARLTPPGERRVAEALPLWEAAHARIVSRLGAEGAAEVRDRFDAAVALLSSARGERDAQPGSGMEIRAGPAPVGCPRVNASR